MNTSFISQKFSALFQDRRKLWIAGLLAAVLLLGAFLRFYELGASSDGNGYYAAAVKSMLLSWKNFFFVAFEPGGSVSVDKPPLGFWVQAISAFFLGVNGFALALPNALAGVLSIFLVYKLVSRPFGPWAGLASALALALMPAAISAERNNTIDGLLVCVLLLAALAFVQAAASGRARWLFLGAVLVGLGFNIKMLQAFLPLPAFYAVYFCGARFGWRKKFIHLGLATILLLAVSFAWIAAVDLTPAADRPYVDSTQNNSALELVFGHNGIERLTGMASTGSAPQDGSLASAGGRMDGSALPPGRSGGMQPPAGALPPGGSGGMQPPGGSMDFGTAGTLRLFTQPLSDEASWLLPFVLGGLAVIGLALWKRPFGARQTAVLLWAGWLLPETIYFTYSSGLMHAYYLIMLGAPIAALAGITAWALWKLIQRRALLGWGLAAGLVGGTLAFQAVTLQSAYGSSTLALAAALALVCLGAAAAAGSKWRARLAPVGLTLLLAALLVAPGLWSTLTTFNASPNVALPSAGPATHAANSADGQGRGDGGQTQDNSASQSALIEYLLANTTPGSYLLATARANDAASLILATGRPVLTFGGFLGEYQEVTVAQLAGLVQSGQLSYVLGSAASQYADISAWVQSNCTVVDSADLAGVVLTSGGPGGPGGRNTSTGSSLNGLYHCSAATMKS
jgi:4-amino-4-deoxy-L-arabinose transferase-like glycosyltransferase